MRWLIAIILMLGANVHWNTAGTATTVGYAASARNRKHSLLRGARDYTDPRIHFAVNCASIGCPPLRPEAYVGKQLAQQLDDQTRRFLGDRSRRTGETSRHFGLFDCTTGPVAASSPANACC